jgi:2-oxoisovalerate dehydrogenase E1 component
MADVALPDDLDSLVAAELFEAQVRSRIVDHVARWLRQEHGIGYYTIGSAGHESNAAVAMALRPTDPALTCCRETAAARLDRTETLWAANDAYLPGEATH